MAKIIRPTLVVDKEVCLRNIEKMAQKAAEHKMRFRPHFKTHQSARIAEWFKLFGVDAITVSSVRMAEYFAANSWTDITLAFPVNILEIENINRLAANIKLNVLVENKEAATVLAEKISHPLGVYLEIDTGYNRTGISSSKTNTMNSVINLISKNTKLTFKGFLTHTGHTYEAKSTNEIFSRHFDALLKLRSLKQKYIKDFPNIEISMGDTPSASICTTFGGVDEIRPGNFAFYDLMQQNLGICKMEDIAVRMICPVVSKHLSRNEIVVYGGAVHISKDSIINSNGKKMYGRIVIRKNGEKKLLGPLNYVSNLSQEHGTLKVTQNQFENFQVGDLVEIIPVHSCLTANLSGYYQTTDGEMIKMMPRY
ncbi:MAG: alanine racemase [Bacteroidetes bacterium]|nr:alanine racemase [Bacteroidota bacterium]